ncbi:hypothetical protein GQ600_368 [Phytophthora cactorum]|nr:hypothetical protein GQ600_368 [Phytophthora cactorum]
MAQEVRSSFRFLQSKYTQEEITTMRKIWETAYGFLAQLRKPSDMENKVADFPVYPDFQTRARLVGMITVGLQHGRRDKDKVISLLKEAKQVYYDRNLHAVHIIFWTRELAAKCSRELHSLPFRNRTFTLRNEHEAMENLTETDWLVQQVAKADWGRRSMDEAAIDAYIRKHFEDAYTTWQEPNVGNQHLQADTWTYSFVVQPVQLSFRIVDSSTGMEPKY